jgi:putative alpha-1,2-mannosidase
VRFSIGRPLFPEVRVNLPRGGRFVVQMKGAAPNHPYVQRVTLNGKALTTPFINYADIVAGGRLVFEMGDRKTVFWKN